MSFTWFGRQVDVDAMKDKYYDKDSPYGFPDGHLFNWNDNYHRNPWWQVYENPTPDSRDRVIAQVSADYQFAPWLTGLVRAGGDSYRFTADEHFAAGNIDRANAVVQRRLHQQQHPRQGDEHRGAAHGEEELGDLRPHRQRRRQPAPQRLLPEHLRARAAFSCRRSTTSSNAGIAPSFTERRIPLGRQLRLRLGGRDGQRLLDRGGDRPQRLVVDAAEGELVVLLSRRSAPRSCSRTSSRRSRATES